MVIEEQRFLPPNSLVLSGNQVYDIVFKGIEYRSTNNKGIEIDCDIRQDWDNVAAIFDNALADISEITNNQ